MYKVWFRTVYKPILLSALFGLLIGLTSAHAAAKSTYNVIVGNDTPYGLEPMAFFPKALSVHRGDTVKWQFRGFHNVRFDTKPLDAIVVSDIDGTKLPEFNGMVIAPSAKSGETFKPGLNTGIEVLINPTAPEFSVVMDVAPGTYSYLCDLHPPNMLGTVTVVADTDHIPSAADVEKQGQSDLAKALADGDKALLDNIKQFTLPAPGAKLPNDTLQVSAGALGGSVSVNHFFPEDATIVVGQSVTWTIANAVIHTINFPLAASGRIDAVNIVPFIDSKKMPHILITEAGNANVKSGVNLPADGVSKSGILLPGQSFTLKFTKPGVYQYYCAIHEDMFGTIEVDPAGP